MKGGWMEVWPGFTPYNRSSLFAIGFCILSQLRQLDTVPVGNWSVSDQFCLFPHM